MSVDQGRMCMPTARAGDGTRNFGRTVLPPLRRRIRSTSELARPGSSAQEVVSHKNILPPRKAFLSRKEFPKGVYCEFDGESSLCLT